MPLPTPNTTTHQPQHEGFSPTRVHAPASAFTPGPSKMRRFCLALCLCLTLLLTGCQEQLYTGLAEQDANEILALLLDKGMDARKQAGEKGTWNVTVERDHIAASMDLLERNGLPRARYESMGDIFQKQGIISSPLEEKARFIFALSQEVANTISNIDGVLAARVHIVLPEEDALGERTTPSSASVFIKHRRDVDLESKLHQIKKLVENSIQGLKYDSISTFLFPAAPQAQAVHPLQYNEFFGIKVAPESLGRVKMLLIACALMAVALIGGGGLALMRMRAAKASERKE